MSQLKMHDLFEKSNQKQLKRMEIYDDVLVKCHKRIQYNSQLERTYCFYQIPEFIIGVPLYDVVELRQYIMNSLKTNGFELLYVEPNWLFIQWNVKGAKSLTKNNNPSKSSNQNSQYKSTDTYKPSGSFIYDDKSLMNMTDKFKF